MDTSIVGAFIHYALVRPLMRVEGVMNESPYILTHLLNGIIASEDRCIAYAADIQRISRNELRRGRRKRGPYDRWFSPQNNRVSPPFGGVRAPSKVPYKKSPLPDVECGPSHVYSH